MLASTFVVLVQELKVESVATISSNPAKLATVQTSVAKIAKPTNTAQAHSNVEPTALMTSASVQEAPKNNMAMPAKVPVNVPLD